MGPFETAGRTAFDDCNAPVSNESWRYACTCARWSRWLSSSPWRLARLLERRRVSPHHGRPGALHFCRQRSFQPTTPPFGGSRWMGSPPRSRRAAWRSSPIVRSSQSCSRVAASTTCCACCGRLWRPIPRECRGHSRLSPQSRLSSRIQGMVTRRRCNASSMPPGRGCLTCGERTRPVSRDSCCSSTVHPRL